MADPIPKPAGQRRRRNRDQPAPRTLPSGGRQGKAPALPSKRPGWLKLTREWWKTIWASPMATVWLNSDVPTLVRLAHLVEESNRGEASAAILAEIRQLEDRFGLSPLSRRRLQWEIGRVQETQATEPALRRRGGDPRLRIVS